MTFATYGLVFAIFLWAAYSIYFRRHWSRISLADIPGPNPESYLLGNTPDLYSPECGVTEAKWQDAFGALFRIKGSFGEDVLYIADAKALQHLLQKGGYKYRKTPGDNAAKALCGGRGVFWAERDVHKLYRKATAAVPEISAFLPVLYSAAHAVVHKWKIAIATGPSSGKSASIDLNDWMSRISLDVMGQVGFDHDFRSIDGAQSPLQDAYTARTGAIFDNPSFSRMLFEGIHNDIPLWILDLIHRYMPTKRFIAFRKNKAIIDAALGAILKDRENEFENADRDTLAGRKDMMSMLVKSRLAGDKSRTLRDDEIIEQVISTIFGGHGTIALSMTWTIYEIAKHPDVQDRMRVEIMELLDRVYAREDTECTVLDLDSLHYTNAVIRECYRFQSMIINLRREAAEDDVLPLHKPIVTRSGKVIKELPIAKGTRFYIAVHGYHMNRDVWGDDVNEFKPERWFENKTGSGLFGNVLNFSSGIRSCPGRRFSMVAAQVYLVTWLSNFQFSIPADSKRIVRHRAFVMLPMVEGESHLGPRLPITITPITT